MIKKFDKKDEESGTRLVTAGREPRAGPGAGMAAWPRGERSLGAQRAPRPVTAAAVREGVTAAEVRGVTAAEEGGPACFQLPRPPSELPPTLRAGLRAAGPAPGP